MKIRIASRKSDLAQIQSRLVAKKLLEVKKDLEIEFVFKDVPVDNDMSLSLVDAESKGLFTKGLSDELRAGNVDLVVHSWKDLPIELIEPSLIGATLEREDPRDIVFFKKASVKNGVQAKPIKILSSSPRREYNLKSFLGEVVFPAQEVSFEAIRGNIPTRLRKFLESDADGFVLALAAVKRLLQWGDATSQAELKRTLSACSWLVIPLCANPPAPGQGALAIEVSKKSSELRELLAEINCAQTFADVEWERSRLKYFGGGCHLKLGIYSRTTQHGQLLYERGHIQEAFESERWIPSRSIPNVKKFDVFDSSDLNIFSREKITPNFTRQAKRHFFLISRDEALPDFVTKDDILWCSGLTTFKKLRARGYWVSGTHEGLGETFSPLPVELLAKIPLYKFSHEDAPETLPVIATYRLDQKEKIPDLRRSKIFYWKSASLFQACVEASPSILGGIHACGLGNTYDILAKKIPHERIFAFPNRESFLAALKLV